MMYFITKMMDDEPGAGGSGTDPVVTDEPGAGGSGTDPEPIVTDDSEQEEDEKEYGYARDLADIADPGTIPAEVTENALTYFKSDHFQVQDPENPTEDAHTISVNGYVIEVTPTSQEATIKAAYETIDAAARQAVAEEIIPPADDDEPAVNSDQESGVS